MSLLDLPSAKAEGWRWSDLSALPALSERRPSGLVPEALPWLEGEGPRLLFVDGRYVAERSAPGGIEIGTAAVEAGGHALARLAGRDGWKLRLGGGHMPSGLVQIVHVATGGADHLAAAVELDVDAQASVVET